MSNILKVGASSLLSLSIFSVSILPGFAQPTSEHNANGAGTTVTSGSGSVSNAGNSSQTESATENRTDHVTENNSNASTQAQSNASSQAQSESGFSLGSPQDGNPRALPSGPPVTENPNGGNGSAVPSKPMAKVPTATTKAKHVVKPQVKTYHWNK